MTHLRRGITVLGISAVLLVVGVTGALGVIVLSNGVLATAAPAWTTELQVAGHAYEVNVAGLLRLATAPGTAVLFDGRAFTTSAGRITLRREGRAIVASCAPCRLQHPALASTPLQLPRVEVSAERSGATVTGWLTAATLRVEYSAELASDRIRLYWRLPPTDVGAAYHALATIVPEALGARIEGTLEARGHFELPSRTGAMRLNVSGLDVGGLGTEALQFGGFAMTCRKADGGMQRIVNGDSETRWVSLDRMGAYLPAAVLAAEDQRFHIHSGFDEAQVAPLLASLDESGPKRGASTVTQQLARTLFTGGEKTAARKLRELLYAIEMERTLGKARILELYLNTVDWGPGLCGARAAARTYFRKRPEQLTPLEAAWLAGILRAPHSAHELQFRAGHPETGHARWVLMQMRSLPKSERQLWARKPLSFAAAPRAARSTRAGESAHRDADRNASVAEAALETAEAAGDRGRAVGAAAVVR
jgi:Transglycosylase